MFRDTSGSVAVTFTGTDTINRKHDIWKIIITPGFQRSKMLLHFF